MRKVSLVFIGCCLWSMTVNATTIRSLTIAQRVAKADRVAIALVESIEYVKSPTQHRIYTLTKLRVLEPLKGQITKDLNLTVRQIGGTIGDWTQHVPGDATFVAGKEVLVFLRHDPKDDLHFLVGMGQGKIDVDVAADTIKRAHGIAPPSNHPTLKLRTSSDQSSTGHLSFLVEQIRQMLTPPP